MTQAVNSVPDLYFAVLKSDQAREWLDFQLEPILRSEIYLAWDPYGRILRLISGPGRRGHELVSVMQMLPQF